MLKSMVAALILVCSTAFAQSPAPSVEDKPKVHVPEMTLNRVPADEVLVTPQQGPEGAYKSCETLRGTGLVVINIGGVSIMIVIDCPTHPTKDI